MRNFLLIVFVWLGMMLPVYALAATVSVSATPVTVSEGDIITARVIVNPEGTAINNAEAVLHYPTGTLQALSVSKGSLFTLWVEEPTLSSGAGTVSFNGGVPNPGVSSSGTAVSVTFKALRSGTATLSLTGAAVRANDGFGTNVLSGSSGTQVTIMQAIVAPTPTPTTPKPTAPVEPVVAKGPVDITSSSHPSSESWYQDASPYFSWTLPKGATAVQLGIDTSATEAPTVSYTKPISEKTIENLEDGTWYFRMRYRSGGVWSEISTYRVKIDATAPSFNALEALYDENESAVFVRTEGTDDASGVVGYEVTLDDGKTKTYNPQDVENKSIRVPVHSSGLHSLKVTLIDAAGNRTTEERTFSAPQTLLNQTLFKIGPVHISLLIALLSLTFISLLSIFIAVFEWLHVQRPRARRSSAIPVVRKGMHQAFLKMKANMEKDVRALDRARTRRELSKEELMLYRRLLANLTALERHLDQILEEAE